MYLSVKEWISYHIIVLLTATILDCAISNYSVLFYTDSVVNTVTNLKVKEDNNHSGIDINVY